MSRREALSGALSLAGVFVVCTESAAKEVAEPLGGARTLEAQRLDWAGIHLRERGLSLFMDPWASPAVWDGSWTTPIPDIVTEQPLNYVAVTHLHQDHFDFALIKKLLASGGSVICHEPMAASIASRGIAVRPVSLFHPTTIGDPVVGELTLVPIPAVDGAGDDQVSWIVVGGGRRILHAGDTLTHGSWWRFGQVYGPFDAVFLPINGASSRHPGQLAGSPLTMPPEHAVSCALALRTRLLIPVHYGIRGLSYYIEREDAVDVVRRLGASAGLTVQVVTSHKWVNWIS